MYPKTCKKRANDRKITEKRPKKGKDYQQPLPSPQKLQKPNFSTTPKRYNIKTTF